MRFVCFRLRTKRNSTLSPKRRPYFVWINFVLLWIRYLIIWRFKLLKMKKISLVFSLFWNSSSRIRSFLRSIYNNYASIRKMPAISKRSTNVFCQSCSSRFSLAEVSCDSCYSNFMRRSFASAKTHGSHHLFMWWAFAVQTLKWPRMWVVKFFILKIGLKLRTLTTNKDLFGCPLLFFLAMLSLFS